jgi:3',5'-cyclic AMP phosphodiesterase CpdA
MNIVQLSDTHFGTECIDVENALIAHLNAMPADVIILTGDVTQRARREQFKSAQNFLAKLPDHQLIAMPGNHDIPLYHLWRRIFSPYRGFLQVFKQTEGTLISESCTIIGINSSCPMKHKDGLITPETISEVAKQLRNAEHSPLRIVAAHHPVAVVLAVDRENIVANAEAAVSTWSAAGMDLMLGGHIHYPFMAPMKGHFPHLDTDAWIVQAGTAVSRRVRSQKPNSFNRIVIDRKRESARIEQWNYESDVSRFELAESFSPWAGKEHGSGR